MTEFELLTTPKVDIKFSCTTSEQGAEIARRMSKNLLEEFGIKVEDKNWSVEERLRTNGVNVMETLYSIRDNEDSRFLKAPGITPDSPQMFNDLNKLWEEKNLTVKNYEEVLREIEDKKVLEKETKQLKQFIKEFENLKDIIKPEESKENRYQFFAELTGLTDAIEFNGVTVKAAKEERLDPNTKAGSPVYAKEAYSSPNADVRGLLGADLKRWKDDGMNSIAGAKEPPKWDENTPIEVRIMPFNNQTYTAQEDGTLKYSVVDGDGNKKLLRSFEVTEGTPIEFNKTSQQELSDFYKEGIEHAKEIGADPTSAFKQTVLKAGGFRRIKLFNEALENAGYEPINPKNEIIDAVFERTIDRPPTEKGTVLIIGNPDYGSEIKETIEAAKAEGIHPPKGSVVLIRASAAGEQYGGLETIAGKDDKALIIELNGKELGKHALEEGDLYREIHYSKDRIEKSIENVFTQAENEGISKACIALDIDNREYDKRVGDIAKEVADKFSKETGVDYEIVPRAKAGKIWLTEGTEEDVVVWIPNLWGDVLSDKQWGSMCSALLFADGREGYELGAKGTDPANEEALKQTGVFKHSVVDILNGQGLSLESTGKSAKDEETKEFYLSRGEALRNAVKETLQNGYAVPYISGSSRLHEGQEEKIVGADTMMKSVELEMLNYLKDKGQVEISDEDLKKLQQDLNNTAKLESVSLQIDKLQGGEQNSDNRWRNATSLINEAKKKVNPNAEFNISLPEDTDYSKVTPESLLAFQETKAAIIESTQRGLNGKEAVKAFTESLESLGIEQTNALVQKELSFAKSTINERKIA